MKIKTTRTTKYKGKILKPGIHDITKAKFLEWKKLGFAEELDVKKTKIAKKPEKDKTEPSELLTLQNEAKSLEIELLKEIELAVELDLEK